jgi:hypothetical protein
MRPTGHVLETLDLHHSAFNCEEDKYFFIIFTVGDISKSILMVVILVEVF